jgi:hypothetical protein
MRERVERSPRKMPVTVLQLLNPEGKPGIPEYRKDFEAP